ncbi:MAG: citrate lyase subunit beta / citryl-CoA lyase [Gaiellales bacterium]|nr:citrate lyase subunit beta / citryl-CoA lyase [Gaiellales bacterium]
MDATRLPLRSVLFAPGNDGRKIAKALGLDASLVMLDLEDAVAAAEKAAARATVCETLQTAPVGSAPLGVRINALASGLADADLDALAEQLARIAVITIPMVEGPDEVRHVAARLDELERDAGGAPTALLVMAETARGILAAREIAEASERVRTLLFGPADLGRELGVEPTADGFEHLHARSALVLAARAADREAPVDGPYLRLDDDEGCAVSARWSRRLGFQGKVALHPRQLPILSAAFTPGERELAWAREVDRAFRESERDGVSSLKLADGTFVDYAVVARARALLGAAEG